MSRIVTMGPSGSHYTPPTIEALKRKKRMLAHSLDTLISELSALERQRDDAAAASLNGGGNRARRQYDVLVEQLAKKASEKTRLQHAITGLDAQLADERQRIAGEQQRRKDEQKAAHREKCIRISMGNRKSILENHSPHADGFYDRAANWSKRQEIELQLAHLREIAEIEYDDALALEEWGRPRPCGIGRDGRPIVSDRPLQPPQTPMVIWFGLPPRPRDLGEE